MGSNQTSTAADHITDKRKTHTQGLDITTNITRIRGGTANKTQQIINPTPRTNDYYGDPIIPRQDICQILSQNIQGIRDDLLFTDARLIRDEADAHQPLKTTHTYHKEPKGNQTIQRKNAPIPRELPLCT